MIKSSKLIQEKFGGVDAIISKLKTDRKVSNFYYFSENFLGRN